MRKHGMNQRRYFVTDWSRWSRCSRGRVWVAASRLWMVVAAVLVMGGCEGVSFLTEAVMGRTEKAVYEIEDRPTLVLVDDPSRVLDDPAMALQIAANIGFQLEQNQAVTSIVPLEKLLALQTQLGEAFGRTPVSRIGREVGAEQVIHVHLESVDFGSDPGLVKPIAVTRVKLIDSETGNRLFPNVEGAQTSSVAGLGAPGHPVTTELWYRNQDDDKSLAAIRRKLAEDMARDVGRLFHEYKPRQTGQPYDD